MWRQRLIVGKVAGSVNIASVYTLVRHAKMARRGSSFSVTIDLRSGKNAQEKEGAVSAQASPRTGPRFHNLLIFTLSRVG